MNRWPRYYKCRIKIAHWGKFLAWLGPEGTQQMLTQKLIGKTTISVFISNGGGYLKLLGKSYKLYKRPSQASLYLGKIVATDRIPERKLYV